MANVEDVLAIDIRVLRRLGAFRRGECIITPVCWSNRALSPSSANLRIDLSEQDGGTMTIIGTMLDSTITQRVAIERISAMLGGHRCYFICPATSQRCEVLYFLGGRFASRRAQRLSYAVQSMADLSRAQRKAHKLAARLKGANGFRRLRGRNRIIAVDRMRRAEVAVRSLWHANLTSRS